MKDYILLLPIIFIIHDMEEIIGFERFFNNNPWLYDRFPKLMNGFCGLSTARFALGVYEEFIPFFGVSLLAYYFPGKVVYGLWFGMFLSLAGHFLIHIGQAIYIRKYIPCLITTLACLPVSVIILIKAAKLMVFDAPTVICVTLGTAVMIINMALLFRFVLFDRSAGRNKQEENE